MLGAKERGGLKGVEVSAEASGNNRERGSGGDEPGLGNLRISPCLAFEFLHREKKMQLHVPSQPFQASVVCRCEVGGGLCPVAASAPVLYANRPLFCILTGVWWHSSEWGAAEGERRPSAM